MTRFRLFLAVLGLIIHFAPAAPATASEEPPPERRIFWNPLAPEEAYFIPAKVLAETDPEDLPLTPDHLRIFLCHVEQVRELWKERESAAAAEEKTLGDREAIERGIERQVEEALAEIDPLPENRDGVRRILERQVRAMEETEVSFPGPCDYADPRGPTKAVPKPFEPGELTRHADFVFVGRVLKRVPGWSVARGRKPATMIFVDVLEVLRDFNGSLRQGEVVPYMEWSGEFEVAGTRLCTIPLPGTTPKREEDIVLLFADVYHREADFLDVIAAFPILDGVVLPQPYEPNWNLELRSFEEVEEVIRANAGEPSQGE